MATHINPLIYSFHYQQKDIRLCNKIVSKYEYEMRFDTNAVNDILNSGRSFASLLFIFSLL